MSVIDCNGLCCAVITQVAWVGCLRSYGLTKCVNVLDMNAYPECG